MAQSYQQRIGDSTSLRLARAPRTKFAGVRVQERPFGPSSKAKKMQRAAGWIRCFSGSLSFVAVVQPTDLRHRHNPTHFWRLNRSWLRRVLP
jgi:hypothetical protein